MRRTLPLFALTVFALACSSDAPPESMADDAAPAEATEAEATMVATVEILEPADGSVIEGNTVTVRLNTSGVRIVAAGDTTSGTGHHHLYLNADLTPIDQPVPTVPNEIVHMGDGSAEFVFEDVPAGEHRLIAVVADGVHIPLNPWVVDTVTFTVR